MKGIVTVICIAALLCAVLSLAGCGIDGTYKAVRVITETGETREWTPESTLTIKGNRAVSTNLWGYQETVEYVIDTKNKIMIIDGKDQVSYVKDGSELRLVYDNGFTIVLEKQ